MTRASPATPMCVALTAATYDNYPLHVRQLLADVCVDHVRKPFDRRDLTAAIDKAERQLVIYGIAWDQADDADEQHQSS